MTFSNPDLRHISTDTVGSKVTLLLVPLIFLLTFIVSGYASIDNVSSSATNRVTLDGLSVIQPVLVGTSELVPTDVNGAVTSVLANVSLDDQATSIDITSHPLSIDLRSQTTHLSSLAHNYRFVGSHNSDHLLDVGENLQIQIFVDQPLTKALSPKDEFALDIKPQTGPILTLHKTPSN